METAARELPKSRLFWRRTALAPVCLVLVAGLHAWRVAAHEQSAWKGGGFGMFSTVDAPHARFIRVYGESPAGRAALTIPDSLAKIASELRTAPSQGGVDELAALLLKQTFHDDRARWHQRASGFADSPGGLPPPRSGEFAALVAARADEEGAISLQRVCVELWRYDFDRASREVHCVPLYFGAATRE